MYEFLVEARAHYEAEQSMPQQGLYRFAYTITVTNTGDVAAQLIARHWLITDAHQMQQEVHGLGVVGRQPLLQPGESFEYTSGCQLRTPNGSMQGSFLCVSHEGEVFECAIARFQLRSSADSGSFPDPDSRVLH